LGEVIRTEQLRDSVMLNRLRLRFQRNINNRPYRSVSVYRYLCCLLHNCVMMVYTGEFGWAGERGNQ